MIDVFLPLAVKNTGISLAARLKGLPLQDAPVREVRDICTCYRVLGIGHLLLSADPTDYAENLGKSGLCWLYYLQNNSPKNMVSSWGAAFFDAVSCLDTDTAQGIAKQSPASHNASYEYEEEFLYMAFIMRYYAGETPKNLEPLLASWSALLNGIEDARLGFCEALIGNELDPLQEALLAAIGAVRDELNSVSDTGTVPADHYAALAHVSTEVVTWVQLCKAKGLAVEEDYALAPSPAVLSTLQSLPAADSWRILDKTYNSLKEA